jgi:hypothetical protein
MEIVAAIVLIFLAVVIVKILGFLLKAGFFVLTVPLRIVGALFAAIIGILIFLPLGVIGGIIAVIIVPLMIILLPVVLVILGIIQLLKHS